MQKTAVEKKERGREQYILRATQETRDFSERHAGPLADNIAPTHISSDGAFLVQIVVPLPVTGRTIEVLWRKRSPTMAARGCDACVRHHSDKRKHCSANLPPGDPGRLLDNAPHLPHGHFVLYELAAGRGMYPPQGAEGAAVWEWANFRGDLERHTSGTGTLRLVRYLTPVDSD
jgi:hypothetical protein